LLIRGIIICNLLTGSRGSQLDWSSIFRIIEGVAQGVQYLHEQRVLHKDVQPRNILVDSDMNPIITDFSISKALDDVDEMIETLEGTV
jgi:L1 cell adhesion molecule like protein